MRLSRRIARLAVVGVALAVLAGPPAPTRSAFAAPASLEGPGREPVSFDTADGLRIAATYASLGAPAGSSAVVLVHGEGQTRAAFLPLLGALEEHRVPWLAIDLRGHGGSAEQDGKSLSGRVKDPTFTVGFADDVAAAVRWLVDARRHDPKRIGVLAAGIGASAAIRAAKDHKGELAALALLTPSYGHPGFDTKVDATGLDGAMDFLVLASVEDMNRLDKRGPRELLYHLTRERNAPPDTRREERILKRRGIPPRLRAFAETNVYGTRSFDPAAGVAHFGAWLAAWWARRFETLPHAVLFDGSVDRKNDYADPGWDGTTAISGGEQLVANAVRWGTRVMVGAELPDDVDTIYLRIYASRGDGHTAGQYAQIAYPSGVVSAQALFKSFMGRAPPTETAALVLQPEEIPQKDGTLAYGKPSFEAEMRLPALEGPGPLEVRVSFTVGRGGSGAPAIPGIDPEKPETWTLVPDELLGAGVPAPDKGAKPPEPPGRR